MPQLFNNYEAAERRRNILPFGLLWGDISWIGDNEPIPGTATITYASSIAINTATAQNQLITLTGDLTITSILMDGATPPTPTLLRLRFKQDGTGGWRVLFPTSVALYPGFEIDPAPLAATVLNLIYLAGRFECATPMAINP